MWIRHSAFRAFRIPAFLMHIRTWTFYNSLYGIWTFGIRHIRHLHHSAFSSTILLVTNWANNNIMAKSQSILHWGPLTALFLITILVISTTYCSVQLYPVNFLQGTLLLVGWWLWVALILFFFFKAMYTGAGKLPLGWVSHDLLLFKFPQRWFSFSVSLCISFFLFLSLSFSLSFSCARIR